MKNYCPGKLIVMLLSCVALLCACNSSRHSKTSKSLSDSANTHTVNDSAAISIVTADSSKVNKKQEQAKNVTEQQGGFTITFNDSSTGTGKVVIKSTDSSLEIDPGNRQIKSISGSQQKKQTNQQSNTTTESKQSTSQAINTTTTHQQKDSAGQRTLKETSSDKSSSRIPTIAWGIIAILVIAGVIVYKKFVA